MSKVKSKEGNPPKKPPAQTKTICTNSLCKPFSALCSFHKNMKGQFFTRFQKDFFVLIRRLFVWAFFLLGGFLLENDEMEEEEESGQNEVR